MTDPIIGFDPSGADPSILLENLTNRIGQIEASYASVFNGVVVFGSKGTVAEEGRRQHLTFAVQHGEITLKISTGTQYTANVVRQVRSTVGGTETQNIHHAQRLG